MALSIDAALTYYESRGQNWERAAWIKARPCAGDIAVGEAFLAELAPYIWRKHLDFATIADIQAMKRQINIAKNVGEIRVEGHNVKLGLRRHSRDRVLRPDPAIDRRRPRPDAARPADDRGAGGAGRANWISQQAATTSRDTYWFLRARREPAADAARRADPRDARERAEDVAVIAPTDGLSRICQHSKRLTARRLNLVVGYYAELFTEGETLGSGEGNLVFTGSDDDPGTLETLSAHGLQGAVHGHRRRSASGTMAATPRPAPRRRARI